MRGLAAALGLLMGVLAQVTVAPLFPIRGAVPDFVLAALVVITVYGGPRAGMVTVPFAGLLLGFASGRAPGLLIMAYLPFVPLASFADDANLPMNRMVQSVLVGAATGLWARLALSMAAVIEGATLDLSGLLFAVLVPGVILDILLVTIVYLPFRLLGWSARPMTLHRSGFSV